MGRRVALFVRRRVAAQWRGRAAPVPLEKFATADALISISRSPFAVWVDEASARLLFARLTPGWSAAT